MNLTTVLIYYMIGLVGVSITVVYHFVWKPIAVEIHQVGKKRTIKVLNQKTGKEEEVEKITWDTNSLPPIIYDRAYIDKKTQGENLFLAKLKEPIDFFHNSRRTYYFPLFKIIRERIVVWTDDLKTFHPLEFSMLSETSSMGMRPIPSNTRQFYVNRKNAIGMKRLSMRVNPQLVMAGIFVFGAIMMIVLQSQMSKNFIELGQPFFDAAKDLRSVADSLRGVASGMPTEFVDAGITK